MYDASKGSYCASHGRKLGYLHDWKIIKDYPRATVEYCKRCKLQTHFYKADNHLYLITHRRDFLQPTGLTAKLFAWEYGKPNYDKADAIKEQGKAIDGVKDLEI